MTETTFYLKFNLGAQVQFFCERNITPMSCPHELMLLAYLVSGEGHPQHAPFNNLHRRSQGKSPVCHV